MERGIRYMPNACKLPRRCMSFDSKPGDGWMDGWMGVASLGKLAAANNALHWGGNFIKRR
jgi:hypothetical protein